MSNELKKAGTRFPFINLQKAVERAKLLFDADQRGRDIAATAAFDVLGYSGKSSGGFQTIAALKSYGLLKAGEGKIVLSDEALRYFRDERQDEKIKLLKQFALKPNLIAALWAEWGASPPADTVARSHLKTEVGLNDQSARSLLAIYKENVAFAELKGADKPLEEDGEKEDAYVSPSGGKMQNPPPLPPGGKVKIMDGERVAFTEEGQPGQYLKLIASGDVDNSMLEALEDFVKRQRKRLAAPKVQPQN